MYKSSRREIMSHHSWARKKKEQETGIPIRDHMGQASIYFQKQLVSWKFCRTQGQLPDLQSQI